MLARLIVLVLALTSVSCTSGTVHSEQAHTLTTSVGNPYHWRSEDFPIPVVVDSHSVRYDFVFALDNAVHVINALVGREVLYLTHEVPEDVRHIEALQGDLGPSLFDPDKVKLGVCLNYLEPGLQAHQGVLRHSKIFFNYRWLNPKYVETTLAVAIHELLHALGLAHDEDDPHSMMYPTASIERHIQEEDLEYIRSQMP